MRHPTCSRDNNVAFAINLGASVVPMHCLSWVIAGAASSLPPIPKRAILLALMVGIMPIMPVELPFLRTMIL